MVAEQATRATSTLDYSCESRYLVKEGTSSFLQQYASFYFGRLNQLRDAAVAAARARWGDANKDSKNKIVYANRIVDIKQGNDTVVIGIVFRDTSSKPSILADYADTGGDTGVLIPPPPKRSSAPYTGGKVVIEDENGRCTLDVSNLVSNSNNVHSRALTTGLVVAVRGSENTDAGTFTVHDIVMCGPAPQMKLPKLEADKFVCFLSTPALSGAATDGKLEMFLEFLKGTITEDNSAESLAISQLIITGPLLLGGIDDAQRATPSCDVKPGTVTPLTELDRFLTVAASLCPTVIVPGATDPVNWLMPQQPVHRCLLPSSSRGSNLHRAPNPSAAKVDDRFIVGTAGQPVGDMRLYGTIETALADPSTTMSSTAPIKTEANGKSEDADVKMETEEDAAKEEEERGRNERRKEANEILDVLQTMVESRHIAPTCPDTLGAYPFQDKDPFVLDESPHILFAGNQNTFATRLYGGNGGGVYNNNNNKAKDEPEIDNNNNNVQCRLLALPRFCDTGRIVLVNLNTLHCSLREFSAKLEINNPS